MPEAPLPSSSRSSGASCRACWTTTRRRRRRSGRPAAARAGPGRRRWPIPSAATRCRRPAATGSSRRRTRSSTPRATRSGRWSAAASRRAGRAIEAIREAGLRHAEELARARARGDRPRPGARQGRRRTQFAARASVGVEDLESRAPSPGEHGLTLEDWVPWGVVGSVTPINSPSAFIVNHAHHDDRGRQRGRLQRASQLPLDVDAHGRAAERGRSSRPAGPTTCAPASSIPTLESARALVTHAGVDMLVITGGAALIRDAFGTGKRVIAAGPGVPVSVLDETADPVHAAPRDLRTARSSRTRSCASARRAWSRPTRVHDRLLGGLRRPAGARAHGRRGRAGLPRRHRRLGRATRARAPSSSARTPRCCWPRPASTAASPSGCWWRRSSATHPLLWMEQFLPVPAGRRARATARRPIDLGIEVEGGNRHTAMIYSHFGPNVERFARETPLRDHRRQRQLAARPGRRGRGLPGLHDRHRHGRGRDVAAPLRAGAPGLAHRRGVSAWRRRPSTRSSRPWWSPPCAPSSPATARRPSAAARRSTPRPWCATRWPCCGRCWRARARAAGGVAAGRPRDRGARRRRRRAGGRLVVPRGAVVTPLARDAAGRARRASWWGGG